MLALLAAFASVAFVRGAPGTAAGRSNDLRATMSLALDIFTVLAVSAGAFFFLAGTVGLLRFPDTLTRLHALTKADNLGLGLIVLGLLAAGRRAARRAEAGRRLAAGPAVRRDRHAAHCARGATRRAAHMTADCFRDRPGRAAARSRRVDDRCARHCLCRHRVRRLWTAAGARLGEAFCRRRGADRGCDRQRRDRHAAAGCGRTPAPYRGRCDIARHAPVPCGGRAVRADIGGPRCTRCCSCPRSAPTLAPAAMAQLPESGLGNPVDGRAVRLPRARYAAGEGGAAARSGRRLVAGTGPAVGRNAWAAPLYAEPDGILIFLAQLLPPVGIMVGIYMFWVGSRSSRRRVSGRRHPGRHVAARDDRRLAGCAGDRPALAAAAAGRRPGDLPRHRVCRASRWRTAFLRIRQAMPSR